MAELGFNIDPEADWNQVAAAVSMASRLRAEDEAARANAIRWQGKQEYSDLLRSGMQPEEALRRTAHLLFFNEPTGMASIIRSTRQEEPFTPQRVSVDGQDLFQLGPNRFEFPPREQAAAADGELLKEELFPGSGIFAVRNPRGGGLHIVQPSKSLPEDKTIIPETTRLGLLARVPTLQKTIQDMDPKSSEFQSATNAIGQIEAALNRRGAINAPAASNAVPKSAIALLRSRPELASQFDAKYGAGSAARILGK